MLTHIVNIGGSHMANVFSIWTGMEPCEYLHLGNRDFINLMALDEAIDHLYDCHDCSSRYAIIGQLLYQSVRGNNNHD